MRNKVVASILMLTLTAGLAAGCGKKEVDYGIDRETEQNSESSDAGESELLEFKTVDTWEDEWVITDETGHERTVTVDADVIMPEVNKLSVAEVEQQPYDEAFRKQFLSALYENGAIYYHDELHYTKQEYEHRIAMLENGIDEVDAETQEYWQGLIDEYEKLRETAPDEYIEAEEYLSSNYYIGYVGDITCKVEFREAKDCIYALPDMDDKTYWPEVLRDYESAYTLQPGDAENMQDMTNSCRLSMEEARKLADDFLIKIGRDGQLCIGENNLVWKGENYAGVKAVDYEYTSYGYSFTYGTGINHMAFNQFPDFVNFDFAWQEGFDSSNYNNGDSIEIVVTDAGITEVYIEEPLNIRKVYDAVDIVQPDTVKGIVKKEVLENTQRYRFAAGGYGNRAEFNSLRLIYIKLPDETQEGVYTYVPVWCASNATADGELHNHAVFVNAIDGGVIYMDDVYKRDKDRDGSTEDTEAM